MKYRTRIQYTETDKALMWEGWRQGESLRAIARLFDRKHTSIGGILSRSGGIRPSPRRRSANWSPTAPMLLCAGNADPSVFYLNTRLMQELWAMNLPSSQVTVLDVDSPVTSGDAYAKCEDGICCS